MFHVNVSVPVNKKVGLKKSVYMNKYRDVIGDRRNVSVMRITIGIVIIGEWEISGKHWGKIWNKLKLAKES